MAQITHLEVATQLNDRGKVVYKVACGKLLLGHAGVRKNADKVTCHLCRRQAGVAIAPANVRIEVAVNGKCWASAEEAYKWVKATHKTKLGQGASRKCYDLGDGRVIKINYTTARFGDQCASEVRVWLNSDENTRQYLTPILEHGNGWVIMPKAQATAAQVVGSHFGYQIGEEIAAVTKIHDLHPANIGYFGCGQFKVLDYAL